MYSIEEKKQLHTNFWGGFNLYCSRMSFLRGRKKKWMLHQTKVNNVHLKFDPGRDGVQVILEILHRSEDQRLAVYEQIESCKSIMEEGFTQGLIWDFAFVRDNGQEVCRIYTFKEGLDIYRQSQWEEMYQFMAENMYRLEQNFLEIRDLIIR
ncbi:MAG: DUF4268 domain-containing protein [Prolixibacteraceae bacterium]